VLDNEIACKLDVTPMIAPVDEPVTILISGLLPGQPVLLRAQTQDEENKMWVSQAAFVADEQGVVNVRRQAPQSGSYQGIDSMGLFWSMQVAGQNETQCFSKVTSSALIIKLSVESNGKLLSSCTITRLFMGQNTQRIPVQAADVVGTFFLPAGRGPHPAVIVLGGSDGGMHEEAAVLLAAHGYASLALAYIQGPNVGDRLPRYLVNIQLSYFESALRWLLEQEVVDKKRVTVLGHSRGAELALLLGTVFPQIRAVIAASPSSFINSAITTRTIDKPAWVYRNAAFPYVNIKASVPEIAELVWKQQIRHVPVRFQPLFSKAMNQQEAVRKASIPVEKIQGPILLISGQDDHVWPSTIFAEQIIARLQAQRYSYFYSHVSYPDAGHLLCTPYGHPFLPPMLYLPVGGLILDGGGKVMEQAQAVVSSWFKILAFLQQV
jgi:dienelactone hydrolase